MLTIAQAVTIYYSYDMELTTLRYFAAIAHTGHMTRAAQRVGVSQPALSAMLKKLEAEVGAELLHRTGRGVSLTEAGRVFLSHGQDALRRADAAVQGVRELLGLQRGQIRVGAGATVTGYLLPPVFSAVRKAHPGLTFFVREGGSRDVAAAVISGELDLGVVTLPLASVQQDNLLVSPFVDDELRLIVPPNHRLAQATSFRWKDLAGESMVAFEAGTAVREAIDSALARAGVALSVVMELRSIEAIKHMVAAGIGVGFVSRFALHASAGAATNAGHEGLAPRDGRVVRRLAIVRPLDRVPSPAAAEFERMLVRTMGRGRAGGK